MFDMSRTMDSKVSPTTKNSNDNNYNLKKKEELSVQIPTPPISKVETLNSNDLQFDRLQPSDQELGRVKMKCVLSCIIYDAGIFFLYLFICFV